MQLQGGSSNLQGGGNIQIGGLSPQPQPSQTQQMQQAGNPMVSSSPAPIVYNATSPQPTYTDSAGNTYSSQAAADQANANLVAIATYQNALNAIPGQLTAAQKNINTQYGQSKQSLDTDAANALTSYNQSNTQNQQAYRTGQNQVNQQAGMDRQSLLRILAGLGAGGGSEAQYLVPQLVGNVASQGLSGAAQTFGQNAQSLNTNYGNFKNQEKTSEANLANWLDQQNRSAQQNADSSKVQLLQYIAGLQSDLSAANPYLNQISSLNNQINGLGNFNPQYSGSLPEYVAPSLSTFTPATPQAVSVAQQASTPGTTPFLSLLTGQNDKNKQLVSA